MPNKITPLIPTILCGGAGSRLWPISREQHPKPFIRMDDGRSLLQKAYLRGANIAGVSELITVTNRELFFKTEDEYREVDALVETTINNNYILEPFGRNTAPAIASATLFADERYGKEAILLVLAADHLITDQASFSEAVAKAVELAKSGKLVTFGINPTGPETGYGYIEANGTEVIRFVEKPTREKAEEYLQSGRFLWNSGMFCFTVGAMIHEMEEHCPEILDASRLCLLHSQLASGKHFNQLELISEYFEVVPDDSIDYAVMEKTRNAAVTSCDIGWSDIGCWKALGDLSTPDSNNNRIQGVALVQDSTNCTIKGSDRVIGAIGLNNLIIIDTPDALLIADKNHAQDVKKIYAQLKSQNHDAHKHHLTVQRPWGNYTVLEEGPHFKIKRIEVKPRATLSLQLHHHRSEHWIVVSGEAKVTNNDQELVLKVNESTYILAKHKHCLENVGPDLLVMIEVQTGDYLGEDDIVRFHDIYGRCS